MKARYNYEGDNIKSLILRARGIEDEFDQMVMATGGELERKIFNDFTVRAIKEKLEIAKSSNKPILIYSDQDCDGVTSAAIAKLYIPSASVYISERRDGYGLTDKSVAKIEQNNSLIITTDNGIRSKRAVAKLQELGHSLIVSDHHEVIEDDLPDCLIAHPQLGPSTFKRYSGAGVIYKLLKSIYGANSEATQLAAIGTIADVMPVLNENRKIIRDGLAEIRSNPSIGISALLDVLGKNPAYLTESDIGFYVAPVINACGRQNKANIAAKLLMCNDEKEAAQLAVYMKAINEERKLETRRLSILAVDGIVHLGKVVISVLEEDVDGLVGLIANDLQNKYRVPAIVFCSKDGVVAGSCRGPSSFDCSKMLKEASRHIISGGGHVGAAGMSLEQDKLKDMIGFIISYADKMPDTFIDEEFMGDIAIDAKRVPEVIGDVLSLRPFGHGFETPIFVSTINVDEVKEVGKSGLHSRVVVNGYFDIMLFGVGIKQAAKLEGETVRFAFEMNEARNMYTKRASVISRQMEVL